MPHRLAIVAAGLALGAAAAVGVARAEGPAPSLRDLPGLRLDGSDVELRRADGTRLRGRVRLDPSQLLRPVDAAQTINGGAPCQPPGAAGSNVYTSEGTCTGQVGTQTMTFDCTCTLSQAFSCIDGAWVYQSTELEHCIPTIGATPPPKTAPEDGRDGDGDEGGVVGQ